jgi:hypothetical protein
MSYNGKVGSLIYLWMLAMIIVLPFSVVRALVGS